MKGVMQEFLLFIVGIFVVLIILSTVFGKGIAYNILWFIAEIEPSYLQEELKTILTVAAYAPGEFEANVKAGLEHEIKIFDDSTVLVKAPSQLQFSTTPPTPGAFLSGDCEIIKKCTKDCGFIGDFCRSHDDCCSGLSCLGALGVVSSCKSTDCRNNVREGNEECDGTDDDACPGRCRDDCTCSATLQCKDNIDNDGDKLIDSSDPGCHADGLATNPDSYEEDNNDETDTAVCGNSVIEGLEQCDPGPPLNLGGKTCISLGYYSGTLNCTAECTFNAFNCTGQEGDICINDVECCSGVLCGGALRCLSKVKFGRLGGFLVIKKFFENNVCKIKIEEG